MFKTRLSAELNKILPQQTVNIGGWSVRVSGNPGLRLGSAAPAIANQTFGFTEAALRKCDRALVRKILGQGHFDDELLSILKAKINPVGTTFSIDNIPLVLTAQEVQSVSGEECHLSTTIYYRRNVFDGAIQIKPTNNSSFIGNRPVFIENGETNYAGFSETLKLLTPEIQNIGILHGGGPAPGSNAVLEAVVRTTLHRNERLDPDSKDRCNVIGFFDGVKGLFDKGLSSTKRLITPFVTRINLDGGMVLRTARTNPIVKGKPEETDRNFMIIQDILQKFHVDALITIGGDDTSFTARNIFEKLGIPVVHVPKTIDNDIWGTTICFGFETFVGEASTLVNNLINDANTTSRYYLVQTMGRSAGHIALATGTPGKVMTIIGEEFSLAGINTLISEKQNGNDYASKALYKISRCVKIKGQLVNSVDDLIEKMKDVDNDNQITLNLNGISEFIADVIIDRENRKDPRFSGVIVISEGIGQKIMAVKDQLIVDEHGNATLEGLYIGRIGFDDHGNIKLGDIKISDVIERKVNELLRLKESKTGGIKSQEIGYIIRSADPNAKDRELGTNLGQAAVNNLFDGNFGTMLSVEADHTSISTIPLRDLMDENGRTRLRLVDLSETQYKSNIQREWSLVP